MKPRISESSDAAALTVTTVGRPRPLLARLNQRGFRLVMAADVTVLVLALTIPMLLREQLGLLVQAYSGAYYAAAYALVVALHIGTYYFGGLYEREQRLGSRPVLPRVASMTIGAVLLVALVELLTERYVVPRANLFIYPVLSSIGLSVNRFLSRELRLRREGPSRVLLVGAPDDVNLARSHLSEGRRSATVVGETSTTRDLLARVTEQRATAVLLLSTRLLDDVYPEPLETLERAGIGVLQRVSARDTLLGLEGIREIAGLPFVALRAHTMPVSRARFKRAIELAGVTLAAPVILPLGMMIALYIRLIAGKPVLFWQNRVGRWGRVFGMVKFRTMYPGAEEDTGPRQTTRDDPWIVPACRWLRASRLDELPQVYNVVRGEMSVVGPRPERPELTERFERLIPGYARRHEIPPGITGLAQIKARYHTDPEYKLGHDLHYLVNWSPILDLQILLRTIWVVVSRRL